MRIYFAGSIVGETRFKRNQKKIVEICESLGHVVVSREHAFKTGSEVERGISARDVFDRDMWWLTRECDAVVGELSIGSYGVGFELGIACVMGLPVLGLAHEQVDGLSAFVEGNSFPGYRIERYSDSTLEALLADWFRDVDVFDRKGFYIAFEGLNSCGKGTQISLLEERMSALKMNVVCVREPGTTYLGEELRKLLQVQQVEVPSIRAEVSMLMAERAQLIDREIRGKLESGVTVITDRSEGTSLAFQGEARGQGVLRMAALNGYAVSVVRPDVTIYLRAEKDSLKGRERDGAGKDRFELEGDVFENMCFEGYEEVLRLDMLSKSRRWVVVDASLSIEEVHDRVWSIVESVLEKGYF